MWFFLLSGGLQCIQCCLLGPIVRCLSWSGWNHFCLGGCLCKGLHFNDAHYVSFVLLFAALARPFFDSVGGLLGVERGGVANVAYFLSYIFFEWRPRGHSTKCIWSLFVALSWFEFRFMVGVCLSYLTLFHFSSLTCGGWVCRMVHLGGRARSGCRLPLLSDVSLLFLFSISVWLILLYFSSLLSLWYCVAILFVLIFSLRHFCVAYFVIFCHIFQFFFSCAFL